MVINIRIHLCTFINFYEKTIWIIFICMYVRVYMKKIKNLEIIHIQSAKICPKWASQVERVC
jgi:hypothetical protein